MHNCNTFVVIILNLADKLFRDLFFWLMNTYKNLKPKFKRMLSGDEINQNKTKTLVPLTTLILLYLQIRSVKFKIYNDK